MPDDPIIKRTADSEEESRKLWAELRSLREQRDRLQAEMRDLVLKNQALQRLSESQREELLSLRTELLRRKGG
jgi:hypothetical protein